MFYKCSPNVHYHKSDSLSLWERLADPDIAPTTVKLEHRSHHCWSKLRTKFSPNIRHRQGQAISNISNSSALKCVMVSGLDVSIYHQKYRNFSRNGTLLIIEECYSVFWYLGQRQQLGGTIDNKYQPSLQYNVLTYCHNLDNNHNFGHLRLLGSGVCCLSCIQNRNQRKLLESSAKSILNQWEHFNSRGRISIFVKLLQSSTK